MDVVVRDSHFRDAEREEYFFSCDQALRDNIDNGGFEKKFPIVQTPHILKCTKLWTSS